MGVYQPQTRISANGRQVEDAAPLPVKLLAAPGGSAPGVVDAGADYGTVNTTNTAAVAGNFRAVQILADAVFSAFAEAGATGQAITGITLPAGLILYGRITGYTLTSGAVRAYVRGA